MVHCGRRWFSLVVFGWDFMGHVAHNKMFINDAGCSVLVVARKLLPFLRSCAVCNMDVMIIECQCQQFFSRLYLLGFPLWCSSFLSAAARQAAAHLPQFFVFLVRLQYSGMGC